MLGGGWRQVLAPVLRAGDYVVVEDSNLDGHPVYHGWGPSPYDAVTEFLAYNRRAFRRDVAREAKFLWTQAPPRPHCPSPPPSPHHAPVPVPRPPPAEIRTREAVARRSSVAGPAAPSPLPAPLDARGSGRGRCSHAGPPSRT